MQQADYSVNVVPDSVGPVAFSSAADEKKRSIAQLGQRYIINILGQADNTRV